MSTDSQSFIASVIVFVALFLVGCVMQMMANGRLKKYHKQDPNVENIILSISNNSPGRTISFLRFVIKKEFIELHDPTLTIYCNILRVLYPCFVVVFLWLCYVVLFMLPRIQ